MSPPWGGKIFCADSSPVLSRTNVKNVENTIVEVKMLEKTEGQKKKIAGGQKRVCLAFCQSPTSCEHSHAS